MKPKTLETIEKDVASISKYIEKAKGILSPARHGESVSHEQCEEAWIALDRAAGRVSSILIMVNMRPALLGAKGGQKTAERMKAKDPDYFKKIAAMRKTKSGGRPKKQQD